MQRHLLRGDALSQLTRLAEASEAYEEARRIDPERVETLRRLADIYTAVDAEPVLRQLAAGRWTPSSHFAAAKILLQRHAFDDAEALVKKRLADRPDDREAREIRLAILDGRRRQRIAALPRGCASGAGKDKARGARSRTPCRSR